LYGVERRESQESFSTIASMILVHSTSCRRTNASSLITDGSTTDWCDAVMEV
jgi:hypothetical protein